MMLIDLGTGIPTSPSVHEVAREVDAAARIVYVDHDPIVQTHNDALLTTSDGVTAIQADIRRPEEILGDPRLGELIDFNEPVAVLLVAVLHLIPDEQQPAAIIARFRERMTSGSHLVLSQFASDSAPEAIAQLREVASGTPVETYFRSRKQILQFFGGFELVPPGVVNVEQWRPGVQAPTTRLKIAGGVGRIL
jgi:S-adenosyl methyltransferase